jgi:hypothetical protein
VQWPLVERIVAWKGEKLKVQYFCLDSLGKFMTHHNQTGLDDHHRTPVHHSFDPLEAGDMD